MKKKIIIVGTLIIIMLSLLIKPIIINVKAQTNNKFTIKRANFTYNQIQTENNFIAQPKKDIIIGEMFTSTLAIGTINNTEYFITEIDFHYVIDNSIQTGYEEYWCTIFATDTINQQELYNTDERVTIENNIITNYNITTTSNEFLFNIEWTPTSEFEEKIENENLTNNELQGIYQWFNIIEETTQLETPTITRTGKYEITINEQIQNAINYYLYYGNDRIGNAIYPTTNIETYYNTYGNGNYTITAYNGIDQTYTESEKSNIIVININQLNTPTITLNNNTITWQYINNANSYEIYKDNILYATTTINQWTTIENGNYYIKAIANNQNWSYKNSNNSNVINQDNYNDIIGNGTNFYTLFGAIVDSQILLLKSMLNYSVWGINFYDMLKLLVMIALTMIVIRIAMKQE